MWPDPMRIFRRPNSLSYLNSPGGMMSTPRWCRCEELDDECEYKDADDDADVEVAAEVAGPGAFATAE